MRGDRSTKVIITSGFGYLLSVFALTGCELAKTPNNSTSGDSIPTYQAAESGYCSTVTSYTSVATVTITGSATFQRREPFGTSISGGLGDPSAARPIRFAEVTVSDTSGTTIQCATTDASGNYSFIIPLANAQRTVTVLSRANNSSLYAYVYDDPRYNNPYSISGVFTASGSVTVPTMNASATDSTVKGGAFNILDQILEANIFLRANAVCPSTSGNFTGCLDFSSEFVKAPRVTAYWKLGFNPASYYGSTSGISFYVPGYSRLFILGGINGDYNSSDTDHFDNSVILHEYGHFLEDILFASDSPGGSHNGNKVIDPRLAWSEGWGNFFQAAVRNDPSYIDTEGNKDGPAGNASTQYLFYVDLEDQTRDVPNSNAAFLGEGNFREFSVTRLLWDAIDPTSGTDLVGGVSDNVANAFGDIYWSLKTTNNWRKPSAAFRQVGLLHDFQTTLGTSSWSQIATMEKQHQSTTDYAQYVTTSGTCTYAMTPQDVSGSPYFDSGSYSTSHLLVNNDFYYLRVTSQQTVTILLNTQDANSAGAVADLDLLLYNENARFGNSTDIVASSLNEAVGFTNSETVTATLAPGNYLINVMAFTGGTSVGTAANYTLKLNGSFLCPASLP